jgi:hypothetical protein
MAGLVPATLIIWLGASTIGAAGGKPAMTRFYVLIQYDRKPL